MVEECVNQNHAGDADSDNIKQSKQRGRCKLAPFWQY